MVGVVVEPVVAGVVVPVVVVVDLSVAGLVASVLSVAGFLVSVAGVVFAGFLVTVFLAALTALPLIEAMLATLMYWFLPLIW